MIRLLYDVPLSLWIFLYITVMIGSNNLEFSFLVKLSESVFFYLTWSIVDDARGCRRS